MPALRPVLRWSALVSGLVLLTSVTMTTTSATATPAAPAAAKAPAVARTAVGQPSRLYTPYQGARFGLLKHGKADQVRIRAQVLATIQSTWGGPVDRYGLPLSTNGTIRIATWSFGDRTIAKALIAAKRRGVSVQVMAASDINKTHPEWGFLKKHLGSKAWKAGVAGSSEKVSFARACKGSCRGKGGTPHAKFFLFDNVGANHTRNIVFQSSMNLTSFAWHGQWNSAQVVFSPTVYDRFMRVFREMRPATYVSSTYRDYDPGTSIESIFFPLPHATGATDPVFRMLNQTRCSNPGVGNGRTQIRIIQYAIYQSRGEAIAKRLRQLWNAGCDIRIIYSVTTRPALSILRNHSGRGPIPMKQSIIRGKGGTIVKYNHSKWMTIFGNYGGRLNQSKTISGSANWANLALSSDEQMQIINGYPTLRAYNLNFNTTWAQRTSGPPTLAYIADARVVGRSGGGRVSVPLPEQDIPWGKGIYKNMTED